MSFEITKATSTDAKDLQVTLEEARVFKISKGDESWGHEPFTAEEVEEMINQGNTYVAKVESQTAGAVVLDWQDEQAWGDKGTDGKAGYIHRLSTRNAFRGQHLGERVIDWVADKAQEAEREYLRLDCGLDDEALRNYYEKQGFTQVGTHKMNGYICALYERPMD